MTGQEVPFSHEGPEESQTESVQGIREPDAGSDPASANVEGARAVPARLGDAGMGERGSEHDGGDAHVQAVSAAIVEASTTFRSAPLPDPEELAAYERILPGAAERIIHMTERAMTGKEDRLDRELEAEIEAGKSGQLLAFVLIFVAFCLALWMFLTEHTVAGVAILSLPIVQFIRLLLPRSWFD